MKILIAEDNNLLGKSICRALQETGWTVDLACDGSEAWYFLEGGSYDVILLDWMMPGLSGLALVKRLRANGITTPIIMVTAKDAVQDRVAGLHEGADDYLIKPFDIAELLARVQALYRRSTQQGLRCVRVGSLELDVSTQSVRANGKPLDLTGKEYDLLSALASKAETLVNRNSLIGLLYSFNTEPDSNSLDVLLNRVRKKLADTDIQIETIRSKGFILRVAPTNA